MRNKLIFSVLMSVLGPVSKFLPWFPPWLPSVTECDLRVVRNAVLSKLLLVTVFYHSNRNPKTLSLNFNVSIYYCILVFRRFLLTSLSSLTHLLLFQATGGILIVHQSLKSSGLAPVVFAIKDTIVCLLLTLLSHYWNRKRNYRDNRDGRNWDSPDEQVDRGWNTDREGPRGQPKPFMWMLVMSSQAVAKAIVLLLVS